MVHHTHPCPRSSQHCYGPCLLYSCLLALLGSLSLSFFSVPLPEIPGLPPVLLWERAQQKATMVAIRTRKATPAPTATPMMTAIGTDSVGKKQTRLIRDKKIYCPSRTLPSPPGAAPVKLGPDHCHSGSTWECLGCTWAGTDSPIGVGHLWIGILRLDRGRRVGGE